MPYSNKNSPVNPRGGPMSGCGGIRKVRKAARGNDRSSGIRVIYLYLKNREVFCLLHVLTKGDAETFPPPV